MSKKCLHIVAFLNIIKKLKKEDLLLLFDLMNDHSKNILCESVYNLLYNLKSLKIQDDKKRKIRRILLPHKNDFVNIANHKINHTKKNKLLKKQIGSGVFTSLMAVLVPTLISALSKK